MEGRWKSKSKNFQISITCSTLCYIMTCPPTENYDCIPLFCKESLQISWMLNSLGTLGLGWVWIIKTNLGTLRTLFYFKIRFRDLKVTWFWSCWIFEKYLGQNFQNNVLYKITKCGICGSPKRREVVSTMFWEMHREVTISHINHWLSAIFKHFIIRTFVCFQVKVFTFRC